MAAVTHFELLFGCGAGSGACAYSDSDSCSIVVPLLFHCCSILVRSVAVVAKIGARWRWKSID